MSSPDFDRSPEEISATEGVSNNPEILEVEPSQATEFNSEASFPTLPLLQDKTVFCKIPHSNGWFLANANSTEGSEKRMFAAMTPTFTDYLDNNTSITDCLRVYFSETSTYLPEMQFDYENSILIHVTLGKDFANLENRKQSKVDHRKDGVVLCLDEHSLVVLHYADNKAPNQHLSDLANRCNTKSEPLPPVQEVALHMIASPLKHYMDIAQRLVRSHSNIRETMDTKSEFTDEHSKAVKKIASNCTRLSNHLEHIKMALVRMEGQLDPFSGSERVKHSIVSFIRQIEKTCESLDKTLGSCQDLLRRKSAEETNRIIISLSRKTAELNQFNIELTAFLAGVFASPYLAEIWKPLKHISVAAGLLAAGYYWYKGRALRRRD